MSKPPVLRRHKPSGRAYAIIDGKRRYFGKWTVDGPEPAAVEAYARTIAERAVHGDAPADSSDMTVAEIAASFMTWAEAYYSAGERDRVRLVLCDLASLYGSIPASDFGPKALIALREVWVRRGYTRPTCNAYSGMIRRVFKWAGERELVSGSILHNLQCVSGPRKGRTAAPEREPVRPVAMAHVKATLDELGDVVADMVRVQLLSGCRPAEVCELRRCDFDTSGDVWTATIPRHKGAWRGNLRSIYFGPEAIRVLRSYLVRVEAEGYLFDPRHAIAVEAAKAPTHRRPDAPPNLRQTDRTVRPKYDTNSYRRAISRAVDRVNAQRPAGERIPRWSPNQLRHARATELRKTFGIEAARLILGHSEVETTQIYAEADHEKALDIMRRIG